jgi:hypothetical protein
MTKDGRNSDRPRAYEARGLDRNRPNLEQEDMNYTANQDLSPIERIKDLGGVQTLHRGLGGYTRRVRSRAPTGKNRNTTTPVH